MRALQPEPEPEQAGLTASEWSMYCNFIGITDCVCYQTCIVDKHLVHQDLWPIIQTPGHILTGLLLWSKKGELLGVGAVASTRHDPADCADVIAPLQGSFHNAAAEGVLECSISIRTLNPK